MTASVFLSSRFLSPLEGESTPELNIQGSSETYGKTFQFCAVDPQPFTNSEDPGWESKVCTRFKLRNWPGPNLKRIIKK